MPKVLSYTPAWLSRPAPGFEFIASYDGLQKKHDAPRKTSGTTPAVAASKDAYLGARRTIASRGTEVFTAVGNEIRWADLRVLKDRWEDQVHSKPNGSEKPVENAPPAVHKTLKVPVHEQIHQLIPSPNGELLAILTSHTVHIAVLPDASYLDQPDTAPIKVRTHTLGPTIHVLSQPRVISALWHPLGVDGRCLVTVTAEAVVRLWEFKRDNRWCFDEPTLTIDLKKLRRGKSAEDDFSATKIGSSRGFSTDYLDMEVAAACFGGDGLEMEAGWNLLTLWVAMTEGDVYALCPLLPSKWQPPPLLVPSLTTSAAAKAAHSRNNALPTYEQRQYDQQYQWVSEIDKQDWLPDLGDVDSSRIGRVYDRPSYPGPIPKLQGPFAIVPETVEEGLELSDIRVIASKLDVEELLNDDEEDFDIEEFNGLPTVVVLLLTRAGRVYACLDLDGVGGQWLPTKKQLKAQQVREQEPQPELVLLEALETMRVDGPMDSEWPTFTSDACSRYTFFVTHTQGIYFLSLDPWVSSLEDEWAHESSHGTQFRLGVFASGPGVVRERVLRLNKHPHGSRAPATTSLVWRDQHLGYFLLTVSDGQPHAIVFDTKDEKSVQEPEAKRDEYEPDFKTIAMAPTRSTYRPPQVLWSKSPISTFLDTQVASRYKRMIKEEMRLSSASLEIMTEVHRVLSHETYQLGLAASDLFRRCERLQKELHDQILQARQISFNIERLNDGYVDGHSDEDAAKGKARVEERLQLAKKRQRLINTRTDALKRRITRASNRDLSEKEKAWVGEVEKMTSALFDDTDTDTDTSGSGGSSGSGGKELGERYAEIKTLTSELLSEAKQAGRDSQKPDGRSAFNVPLELRQAKVAGVMEMLDRESAVVDAVEARVQRLSEASV